MNNARNIHMCSTYESVAHGNFFLGGGMKNLARSAVLITTIAVLMLVNDKPGGAQELQLSNGQFVSPESFPFLAKRPKAIGYLAKGQHMPFALAIPPAPCPTMYSSAWGGSAPHTRAINRCTANVSSALVDYPEELRRKCTCSNAIVDLKVIDDSRLNNDKFFSIVKLYIKNKSGQVSTQSGFLEYEVPELVKQKARLVNQDMEEVCTGSLTLSLGDGGFDLSCFGGSMDVRGIATLYGLFSKKHSVGSAVLDTGEVFAFVTGLNDAEIKDRYPKFPDIEKVDQNTNDSQTDR